MRVPAAASLPQLGADYAAGADAFQRELAARAAARVAAAKAAACDSRPYEGAAVVAVGDVLEVEIAADDDGAEWKPALVTELRPAGRFMACSGAMDWAPYTDSWNRGGLALPPHRPSSLTPLSSLPHPP